MNQEMEREDKLNPIHLIDLESYLPNMIEYFSNNIDSEYILENFQMKIDDDGITLCDQKGINYELNTGQTQFFEQSKEKIVTIQQGIVKPEFEMNTQNLIFTMLAKEIRLSPNQEDIVGESSFENEIVNARFKIFDMEHNKKKQNLYEKSFVIKKALIKKHSQNAYIQQGTDIWISLTQSYRIEQQKLEEDQAKLLKQQQQEQNKKSGGKKETTIHPEKEDEDKKQQFKTPSKKTKTPLKVSNKQEDEQSHSNKKGQKQKKLIEEDGSNKQKVINKLAQMEIEEEQDEDNKTEAAAEGAVSVAKERKAQTKSYQIREQRKNLKLLLEQEIIENPQKQTNKKRTVQIEGQEYEEEDADEDEELEEEDQDEEIEEVQEEEEEVAFVEQQKQQRQQSEKKSLNKKEQIEEEIEIEIKDEKSNKKSILKPTSTEKQREIIQSLKKKSVQKMKEQQEKEQNEQMQAQLQKEQEYKNKLGKLQKFILKREFLYYIQDFQKKPEVRNAVLPRDPQDKEKMKQYSLKVVKHLESQYK